ncbi:MAG: hypothetical protein D8M59_03525 [Planctomycetes bacterium]|nr:hypothetical protein [Planctomycetota bacterium]NOG53068.1 hypothetical protein [Planctomycetota bacterium]
MTISHFSARSDRRLTITTVAAAAAAAVAACATPGFAQTITVPGTVQRPVIQNVNLNTSVRAPASVLVIPPIPPGLTTAAYKQVERQYKKEIGGIRYRYLGNKKVESIRNEGMARLAKYTQPAAIPPLVKALRGEDQDVQDWLFEHLQTNVDPKLGQSVLTWMSIYDRDEELRERALSALPSGDYNEDTMWLVGTALTSGNEQIIAGGAQAAGQLQLFEAIPLLIQTQGGGAATGGGGEATGALAWIFVGQQRYFVSDLTPVVGDFSAGFDPTLTALNEGSLLVIQDALVEFHRMEVHNALLGLAEQDYGQRVNFGFNTNQWIEWFNDEYMPYKKEAWGKAEAEQKASEEPTPDQGAKPDKTPPPSPNG